MGEAEYESVGESYWLGKKFYAFKPRRAMKLLRSCDSGASCRGRLLRMARASRWNGRYMSGCIRARRSRWTLPC
jgi:hypothetical protein